jgi:hypothetical protein
LGLTYIESGTQGLLPGGSSASVSCGSADGIYHPSPRVLDTFQTAIGQSLGDRLVDHLGDVLGVVHESARNSE